MSISLWMSVRKSGDSGTARVGKHLRREAGAEARGDRDSALSELSASVPGVPASPLQSPSLQRAARRERDRILADVRRIERRLEHLELERERLREEVRS